MREATFDVLRERGMTTIFSNPGSTEVPFLAGLPADLHFVLGLHEGSVVGMATGWAIAGGRPAFVLLHTTAGYGNAVAALATARVNRAPLVVVVGQQDRRHLASEPFLAGRLSGLAGDYPVSVAEPSCPADVPGAIARAYEESLTRRGPAVVIVPMGDWTEAAPEASQWAVPRQVVRAHGVDEASLAPLCTFFDDSKAPALVVGAAADDGPTRAAIVALADRLRCPVWQESFGGRAGFPQHHAAFAGNLPADRPRLREVLGAHDAVLLIGAPAFRQYPYDDGPFVPPSTRVAVISPHADEVHRSAADLGVIGEPADVVAALTARVAERPVNGAVHGLARPAPPAPPADGEPLRAGHVLAALADRLPANTIVIEESPSSRPELEQRLPARESLGYLSAAMGGLGFALPAAAGVRLAAPDRPVVVVAGDGSAMYQIQALWSAARYGAGVLYVVLANGRYAIMDRLAERTGEDAPWPAFEDVSVAAVARGFGCAAHRIETHAELEAILDDVVPGLADRTAPLVLDVAVAPDRRYQP